MPDESAASVTFFSTKAIECPICEAEFVVEKLRGKRINANDLDDELRRKYTPLKRYGKVYPLIYPVVVCPECYYAALAADFLKVSDKVKTNIDKHKDERFDYIKSIFDKKFDFTLKRTLEHGAASYILAVSTYSFFQKEVAPTFKRGLCSLRAAWLFTDLIEEIKEESAKFAYIRDTFYLKAEHYYTQSILLEQRGKERLENVDNMGPDTDKDYKYDGVKYISSLLNYKLAFLDPGIEMRIKKFTKIKSTMGRLFGFGKITKEKPGTILEKAKELFEQIKMDVKKMQETVR